MVRHGPERAALPRGPAGLGAVARLLRGPDDRARRLLRWLGTGLTCGYPSERLVRARVRPGGLDPVETPVVVVGWGCAVAMAVLARRPPRRPVRGAAR